MLKIGDIVCSKYKIEEKISENDFFRTFIISISDELKLEGLYKMVAIPNPRIEIKKEIMFLNEISMHCPYILGFKDVFEEQDSLCLVSHSCLGIPNLRMELDEKRRNRAPYSQNDVLLFIYQLSTALNALHKKELIHGCISPDNILVMNGMFCLIDYGISKFIDKTKSSMWNIVFEVLLTWFIFDG
jgi:serine/threonine protein kinase